MATIVARRLCARSATGIRLYNRLASDATSIRSMWISSAHCRFTNYNVYRQILPSSCSLVRYYGTENKPSSCEGQKLSLFQKFKQMYRDYWYVLVPVHVVTSIAWFAGFYYIAKSGVDIVAIMEYWHISDRIVSPLRDSSMGYLAVSYALYKIATPVRYMVTLGGTTFSINYLKNLGYIKPVPTAKELKVMYIQRKRHLMGTVRDKREDLKVKKNHIKVKNHINKRDCMVNELEKKVKLKMVEGNLNNTKCKKDHLETFEKPVKIKTKD